MAILKTFIFFLLSIIMLTSSSYATTASMIWNDTYPTPVATQSYLTKSQYQPECPIPVSEPAGALVAFSALVLFVMARRRKIS